MTTEPIYDPDDPRNDPDLVEAAVVDLTAERARRAGRDPADDVDPVDDADPDEDQESYDDTPPADGGPVDRTDTPEVPHSARRVERRPILAEWARSWRGWKAAARHTAGNAGYAVAYHAVRTPKYAAKTAYYAPVGLFTGIGRAFHWATAEEGNWTLRQSAANRGDAETWLKLDARRQRQASWRWWVLAASGAGTAAGSVVLAFEPVWWRLLATGILVPVLARTGRPDDKRITDRVTDGGRYRKLTAELVRRALTSLQMPAINGPVAKDPKAISFPHDIHRDGPGHLAIVDLPYGVEATEVCARRGKLASALRLPLDQVWPEPAPGHTGRLALWVGYEPASQMRQPVWPLMRDAKVDVFHPFPLFTNPRMDVLTAELMFRNWLIGGQPGSGKTFTLRGLVLAAALDPRTEIRGYELKGVGDFKVLEPLLAEYGNGFDDETIAACAGFIDWLYEECQRRSKRIAHYAALGKAPENKVTPELASLKGSGLHPLIAWIDEIQELFTHPKFGKAAGEKLEKVIKLGRALGVILLLGTQIPDANSLPPGITRNVNTRVCHSVADQTANDMVLGTSMYRRGFRATVFKPVDEAGWGIVAGLGKTEARRSFYADTNDAAKIVARAVAMRVKAGTLPDPDTQTRDTAPAFDLLGDLARIWPAGDKSAWNETLCAQLGQLRPEVYGGWESAQLTAALKPHPAVKVIDVGRRIEGKAVTRRGISRTDLDAAIADRNRRGGSD
ncbi:cell division protein FtsK [Rugosimonospora africana]|uniref:Cell division protein FtsK n=1 Tax=Rugosimonospora africana TaxID=556532 RepID=A0A8J3R301_9ACTN|nr:cell division protein FtsK [Rugosimonospora africana]GIH21483.1 cell division protein FtsK [Rugosimonospora africana]